jgi:hypothetical protein
MIAIGMLAAVVAALVATSISTAAPTTVNLYAGQNTDIGDITVDNTATHLSIQIVLAAGWCMSESYVAVANDATGIPQVNGNPVPGQFPHKATYSPCATTGSYSIPLAGLDSDPVIAVHAKVWDPASETSTWVYSDGGNTHVTATSALPLGNSLPFASTDAWEAFGDPVDPIPSTWDNGVGVGTFQFADWIWQSYQVQTPTLDETVTFERSFTVPGAITPGSSMKVTTDDAYTASLNGTQVASDVWPNWPTVEDASPFAPVAGANKLIFVSTNSNLSNLDNGTFDNNPGGLIYEAKINHRTKSASAWAGTERFPGKNWATFINYELQDALLETVTVPATLPDGPGGVTSINALATGSTYQFKITGTGTYTNRGGTDLADAECTSESGGSWAANAVTYPDSLLELQVNSGDVDWTPVGTFNAAGCADGHLYTLNFTGLGSTVNFRILDGNGENQEWFGDNGGSLTVEIWKTF